MFLSFSRHIIEIITSHWMSPLEPNHPNESKWQMSFLQLNDIMRNFTLIGGGGGGREMHLSEVKTQRYLSKFKQYLILSSSTWTARFRWKKTNQDKQASYLQSRWNVATRISALIYIPDDRGPCTLIYNQSACWSVHQLGGAHCFFAF